MFSIRICLELVVYFLVLGFLNNISLTFVSKKKRTTFFFFSFFLFYNYDFLINGLNIIFKSMELASSAN